jgi:phosphoglycolate phosphatase
MVGDGLRALVEKALALASLSLTDAEAQAFFESVLAAYRAAPAARTTLHGWVAETMIGLHGEGARIAVCSNKAEDLTLEILEALDASRWIHATVGQVQGRPKKPDPEPLLMAIGKAGGDPARAIMIGDSAADVGAAKGAGIPVVLVPHGYGSRDIHTLGADAIVADARELRAAIAALTG